MFTIFMVVAVIMIIYSAFMFLTARGNPEGITKARNALTWSIVAIVVALLAASIPVLVQSLLGG